MIDSDRELLDSILEQAEAVVDAKPGADRDAAVNEVLARCESARRRRAARMVIVLSCDEAESGCLRDVGGGRISLRTSRALAFEILRQQIGRLPDHGSEVLRASELRLVRISGRPQIIEVPDGSEVLMLSLAAVELRLQSLDSDVDEHGL